MTLSFLILVTSCMHGADSGLTTDQQNEIIQLLLAGKIDPCTLNPEAINLCIQAIEGQKAVLNHVIANQSSFLNNVDAIKGAVGACFGANCLQRSLGSLLTQYQSYLSSAGVTTVKVNWQHAQTFASKNPDVLVLYTAFIVVSTLLIRGAYSYLYKAWYTKTNAQQDLANLQEILIALQKIECSQI